MEAKLVTMDAKAATEEPKAKLKAVAMKANAAIIEQGSMIKAEVKEWESRLQTAKAKL